MTTTLSSKGQVVIPLEIRKKLGLKAGTEIDCHLDDGQIILAPHDSGAVANLVDSNGCLALEAPDEAPEMSPELVRDILSEL